MSTEQLSIIIIGIVAVNALVLIWVVSKLAHLNSQLKHPPKSHAPNVVLTADDKDALKASLTQKADTETTSMLKSLQTDLEGFSHALQSTLLTDATTVMDKQLAEPQKIVAEFNASLTATLDGINKALIQTGEASQAQLKAEVMQHKQLLVDQFEKQMAGVINAYLITALGEAAGSSDQATLVVQQLEQHKEDLRKDLLHEA